MAKIYPQPTHKYFLQVGLNRITSREPPFESLRVEWQGRTIRRELCNHQNKARAALVKFTKYPNAI